ncbi:MAG: fibronectin type III domain-containing protein, partial [Kiritimatiellae bacterium]|nr:fibronectin type III domain-containing protein [Kiritimatiellia bacterium]
MNQATCRFFAAFCIGISLLCGAGRLPAATVSNPSFSHSRGFYTASFNVGLSTSTAGATIRYTTDGSKPTASHGTVYGGAVPISNTTCLRARGFMAGYTASPPVTHTYLFLDKVKVQPNAMSGENWADTQAHMDTAMDPDIVNNATYSSRVVPALKAIPSLSIVMDYADLFGDSHGIMHYPNCEDRGLAAERECSVELIGKDGTGKFQVNAGIRVFGMGSHHNNWFAKRSFRLLFKAAYGPAKLNYALFQDAPNHAGSAVTLFDTITLRGGHNASWAGYEAKDSHKTGQMITYTRDQWVRDALIAAYGYGYHGTFVHLYLNGVYWGLYNPCEGTEPAFFRDYFGGEKDNWCVLKGDGPFDPPEFREHGSRAQWNYLHDTLVPKDLAQAANYNTVKQYLDVTNFADYLLVNWYAGVGDWPGWNYGAGNCNSPVGPIRYMSWDAESCWFNQPTRCNGGAWVHPGFYDPEYCKPWADVYNAHTPTLFRALMANLDFKTLFADRLYAHCANGGALTDANSRARWNALCDRVSEAVIGESARWGDFWQAENGSLFKRDTHWVTARNAIYNMMGGNGDRLIAACRNRGYYPSLNPPGFSTYGGTVAAGFKLTLSRSGGTLFYRTDGQDPRVSGGGVQAGSLSAAANVVLTLNATATVKARQKNGSTWSALAGAAFTVTGSVANPPAAPGSLTARAVSTSQIDLSWQDNSHNETGFKIDRRRTSADTWDRVATLGAGVTACHDTGLPAGTLFYYKVKAYNADGESAYTAVAGATTEPGADQWYSVDTGAWTVENAFFRYDYNYWTQDDHRCAAINSFKIKPSLTEQCNTRSGPPGQLDRWYLGSGDMAMTQFAVEDVQADHVDIRVKVHGEWADDLNKRERIYRNNAVIETAYARSFWGIQECMNPGDTAAGAAVYLHGYGFCDAELVAEPNNNLRRAVEAVGADWSACTFNGYNIIGHVNTQNGQGIGFVWPAAVMDGLGHSWNYWAWKNGACSGEWWPCQLTNPWTRWMFAVAGGTAEVARVGMQIALAGSAAGVVQDWSGPPPEPPAAPSGLTAQALSTSRVALAWTDNSSNETGFRLERRQSGASAWQVTDLAAGTTSHTDTGLLAGTEYIYKIVAYNAAGESAYTPDTRVWTQAEPPAAPAQPTGFGATPLAATQIRLTWTDASDNEDGFRLERRQSGLSAWHLTDLAAGTTSHTD